MEDNIKEEGLYVKFHINPNIFDDDILTLNLSGILRLILIKNIAKYITEINMIKSKDIQEIIIELKKGIELENNPQRDIQTNLSQNKGKNIVEYTNYVCSIIKDENDINILLDLVDQNKKNEIIKFWSRLSKYESFNKLFLSEISRDIENSYFEYSLIGLSMYEQTNRKEYIKEKYNCPSKNIKYLYHGSQIEPISKMITNGFMYTRKAFYGMGIYFTNMLDYSACYSSNDKFNLRRHSFGNTKLVNETFSCSCPEIYYDKGRKKDIYDFSLYTELDHFPTYEEIKNNYKDKMVDKNGIHFVRVEHDTGQALNKEKIIEYKKKGKFIGNEYVITEMSQILPLYGLTFKRNEYFILWRDPQFIDGNDYLKEQKLFINKYAKMNSYFVNSTEKGLEIITRKKYNKVILISSIGDDLSGKKFVEIARQILGFNVVVLFYSNNSKDLSWLQHFPNALYFSKEDYYKDYILNYNQNGIIELKNKIEKCYNIKLTFNNDFIQFPKFINEEKFSNINFSKQNLYFKKVIIKNSKNNSILCMDKNEIISLKSEDNLDINSYAWYITIMNKEITLFSNGYYLGFNLENNKVNGEKFMKIFTFEDVSINQYIIYYKDKNNVLTADNNVLKMQKEINNSHEQIFRFVEFDE